MIDVKQAVKKAAEYLATIYADRPVMNVDVEEVEMTDDERHWLVTLGYTDNAVDSVMASISRDDRRRKYKVFKIDSNSGECLSMKMREPLFR